MLLYYRINLKLVYFSCNKKAGEEIPSNTWNLAVLMDAVWKIYQPWSKLFICATFHAMVCFIVVLCS